MSPTARVNEIGTVEQGPLAAVLAALAGVDDGLTAGELRVLAAVDPGCVHALG